MTAPDTPAPLGQDAYHGLTGQIVREVEPHTEADPAAVLVQLLAAVGSAVGRGPHFTVEATPHYTNLFVGIVGTTAGARKGSSWAQSRRLVEIADPSWAERIATGLSSGEGLTHEVRDAEEPPEDATPEEIEDLNLDDGAKDKRLLVIEEELASVLGRMRREGNTLSEVMRQAWDGKVLDALTKTNRTRAKGAHVSVIGHITTEELRRKLSETERANGFANRFLWIFAQRSKVLPFGGNLDSVDWNPYEAQLRNVIEYGRLTSQIGMSSEARELWVERYEALSTPADGMIGAITARGPAQVRRIAMLYALMEPNPDGGLEVTGQHLKAALTVWDYSLRSARHIFGDSLGDPTADEILKRLKATPDGLTRNEIRESFSRNRSAEDLDRALAALVEHGQAESETEKRDGPGRPTIRWRAASSDAVNAVNAVNGNTAFRAFTAYPEDGQERAA